MKIAKALTIIVFGLSTLFITINQLLYLRDVPMSQLSSSFWGYLKTIFISWYSTNPLFVIIVWGISVIGMIIFFVLPHIMTTKNGEEDAS